MTRPGGPPVARGGTAGAVYLILPYPPTLNTIWRHVGNRTLKSAEGRAYDERVGALVRMAVLQMGSWPLCPPYKAQLVLFPPDRRRRDISNTVKVLEDAVWRAIGQDDSTIDEWHVYRGMVDRLVPRCQLTVWSTGGNL